MESLNAGEDIDRVRAIVQWAYSEQGGVEGSIFELFSGRKTKTANIKPSRRYDGLSASRVHATETRKQGHARIPIASGRSGGEVKRVVDTLPSTDQHWVHWVYNPSRIRKAFAIQRLGPAMWNLYQRENDLTGVHARTLVIVNFMVRIQLEQARTYPGFQKWSASRPEQFADSISRSSWSDTHSARWKSIHSMLLRLDHQALAGVGRRLAKKGLDVAV